MSLGVWDDLFESIKARWVIQLKALEDPSETALPHFLNFPIILGDLGSNQLTSGDEAVAR